MDFNKLQNSIKKATYENPVVSQEYKRVAKSPTYNNIYKYVEALAIALDTAIDTQITEAIFDEVAGVLGTDIVAGVLINNFKHIEGICEIVEANRIKKIGLGIKPVETTLTDTRVKDIARKYDEVATRAELAELVTGKNVSQFMGSIVDEFIEENMAFQYDLGLEPTLIRTAYSGACAYCQGLAGTYEYDGTPECGTGENLFSRHTGCTCTIDVRTRRAASLERVSNYKR